MTLPASFREQDGCHNCRWAADYEGFFAECAKATPEPKNGGNPVPDHGICEHWEAFAKEGEE